MGRALVERQREPLLLYSLAHVTAQPFTKGYFVTFGNTFPKLQKFGKSFRRFL